MIYKISNNQNNIVLYVPITELNFPNYNKLVSIIGCRCLNTLDIDPVELYQLVIEVDKDHGEIILSMMPGDVKVTYYITPLKENYILVNENSGR